MNEQSGAPLFETKTEMTWEEYRKFKAAVSSGNVTVRIARIVSLATSAAGAVLSAYYLLLGAPTRSIFYITAFLALWILVFLFPSLQSRAAYRRLTANGGETVAEIKFYGDRLVSRQGDNEGVLPYADIYKITETRDNFYIMATNVQGVIVVKENCPGELQSFIHGLSGRPAEPERVPEAETAAAPVEEGDETPLYETSSVIDWEEYGRYSRHLFYRNPGYIAWMLIVLALMAFCLVFKMARWQTVAVLAVFFAAAAVLMPVFSARAYYNSGKAVQNLRQTVRFYSDRLECRGQNGVRVCRYDNICRIYETGTNFYIMIGAREGVILVKANCTPELTEFVRKLKETNK